MTKYGRRVQRPYGYDKRPYGFGASPYMGTSVYCFYRCDAAVDKSIKHYTNVNYRKSIIV